MDELKAKSLEGGIVWKQPEESFDMHPNYTKVFTDPESETQLSGSAFYENFKQIAGNLGTFVVDTWYKENHADPDYNPFKDPVLLARGDEFIAQYGESFIDSPNDVYTYKLLDEFDQDQRRQQLMAQNPVAGILGTLTGSVVDPTMLIPIIGMQSKLGLVARTLVNTSTVAAAAGGQAAMESTYNPAVSRDDIITSTLMGAAVGAGVTLMGAGFAANKSMRDILSKGEAAPDPSIKISDIDEESIASSIKNGSIDLDNTEIFDSNSFFTTMHKYTSGYAPSESLMRSPSGASRALGEMIGGSTTLTKGNISGVGKMDSIAYTHVVSVNNKWNTVYGQLEKSHIAYKKAGGTDSLSTFIKNSFNTAGKKLDPNDVYTNGASSIRRLFDDYATELKQHGLIEKDANLEDYWLPHYIDFEKVVLNEDSFRGMLREKWANRPDQLIPPSRSEVDSLIDEFIDDIKNREASGAFTIGSTKFSRAKSLKMRDLNLTNDEIAPYLKDDVENTMSHYIKSMEWAKVFKSKLGNEDPYKAIEELISNDYKTLRKNLPEGYDPVTLEKRYKKDVDNATFMIDVLTNNPKSNSMFNSTSIRQISSFMKSLIYLKSMGMNFFMNMADLGRTISNNLINSIGLTRHMTDLSKAAVKLSPDDARVLGIAIDSHLGARRELGLADIIDDTIQSSNKFINKAHKIKDKVTDVYGKLIGIRQLNAFSRTLTVESESRAVINRIERMLSGDLEKGSFEAIELARFGIGMDARGQKFAKEVLEQVKKHSTEVDKWGGKVRVLNLDKWDTKTLTKFGQMLLRHTNRIVIEPDVGSRHKWMNSALGGLAGQFKGFTMAAYVKAFLPNVQQIGLTNKHSGFVLSAFIFQSMIGSMSGHLRDAVRGDKIDLSPEKSLFYAFDRGGFFPIFDFVNNTLDTSGKGLATALGVNKYGRYYGKGFLEPIMGPSFSYLNKDLPSAVNAVMDGNVTEKDMKKVIRILPLQNLWAWSAYTHNLGK